LASVNDQFNAIYIKGNAAGQVMLYGEGAGGPATASSVVSDLIEIVSSGGRVKYPEFKDLPLEPIDDIVSSFYVRLKAKDMPGVLAGIAGAFGNNKVSIQSALQKETVNGISTLVIVAHDVKEKNLRSAILEITGLPAVSEISNIIRVESEGLK
jgi:homoserine dehydrogenase